MKAQTQASSASVARFICTSQALERSNAIRVTIIAIAGVVTVVVVVGMLATGVGVVASDAFATDAGAPEEPKKDEGVIDAEYVDVDDKK